MVGCGVGVASRGVSVGWGETVNVAVPAGVFALNGVFVPIGVFVLTGVFVSAGVAVCDGSAVGVEVGVAVFVGLVAPAVADAGIPPLSRFMPPVDVSSYSQL